MSEARDGVAIVGAGSWGTALAVHCGRIGLPVRLWARTPEVARAITATGRNPWYLTDVEVGTGVIATEELERALEGSGVVIVAVPSEFFGATLDRLRGRDGRRPATGGPRLARVPPLHQSRRHRRRDRRRLEERGGARDWARR